MNEVLSCSLDLPVKLPAAVRCDACTIFLVLTEGAHRYSVLVHPTHSST